MLMEVLKLNSKRKQDRTITKDELRKTAVKALADAEPVVIVHNEVYVVASTEPEIVQEETFTDQPEGTIESLRAFGRGLTARLRAGALRAEGNARVALASL